jgi:hypothetical protein
MTKAKGAQRTPPRTPASPQNPSPRSAAISRPPRLARQMKTPGCSWDFDGVIGLSETLCVFDGGRHAAGRACDLPGSERAALAVT